MATSFPTSLDSYTAKADGTDHPQASHVNDLQDAVEAIEAKVGKDGSTATSSHDYQLANTIAGVMLRSRFEWCRTLDFTSGGTYEIQPGDQIDGASSSTAAIVLVVQVTSGTWAAGTAAGVLFIYKQTGSGYTSENLDVGANNDVATVAGNSSINALCMDGAVYHHSGTTDTLVSWNEKIGFELGAGGSNPTSDNLGANERHYIYVDDSAVVSAGSGVLTSSEFVNDTTAPTWSHTKKGWYNGDDLCIFGILSDSSSNIREYYHMNDHVMFSTDLIAGKSVWSGGDWSSYNVNQTFTDAYLPIPLFARNAIVRISIVGSGYSSNRWRTNGQVNATGHTLGRIHEASFILDTPFTVFADENGIIEVSKDNTNSDTQTVYISGWYFPTGM
jgi:hypothetical protein